MTDLFNLEVDYYVHMLYKWHTDIYMRMSKRETHLYYVDYICRLKHLLVERRFICKLNSLNLFIYKDVFIY